MTDNEEFGLTNSVLYLDEAGDPTLFAKGGKIVAGTEGCSRFFILGKLEVMDAIRRDQQTRGGN